MKTITQLAILLVTAFLTGCASTSNYRPAGSMGDLDNDLLQRINKLDAKQIEPFCEGFWKERQKIEMLLVSRLKSEKSNHKKCAIVYLLGLYRMENSVQALAQSITLKSELPLFTQDREALVHDYPVVDALINIGKPSVREMIKNIERSDDERVRELSASVIRYVEGIDSGRLIIQKAIVKQEDSEKKKRLQEALTLKYFIATQPSGHL